MKSIGNEDLARNKLCGDDCQAKDIPKQKDEFHYFVQIQNGFHTVLKGVTGGTEASQHSSEISNEEKRQWDDSSKAKAPLQTLVGGFEKVNVSPHKNKKDKGSTSL